MFDGRWRRTVDAATRPVGRALAAARVTPNVITALGVLASVGAACAIAVGRLGTGLALLIAAGLSDLLDGPVAVASGKATVRGEFFDSTADRLSDSLLLGGIAWYLADTEGATMAVLPMAVLAAAQLVSYQRAKAELLGLTAKGGLMERAERTVVLAVAIAFSSLLVPLLWVMLAATALTAIHRFVKVTQQAGRA